MASALASRLPRAGAVACRALAAALVSLAVADAVLPAVARTALLSLNGIASRLLPDAISGLFVFQTPLGGALRGDFVLAAIMLLALAWALGRASALMRRRERG